MDLRKVESLATLDHSKIKYRSFKKNFFKPHPEINSYTGEQMRKFYEDNQIQLSGGKKPPRPCPEFKLMSLPKRINRNLEKQGFSSPTPIQACSIPCILSGSDLLGIAKTGSGKTVAFVLPMLVANPLLLLLHHFLLLYYYYNYYYFYDYNYYHHRSIIIIIIIIIIINQNKSDV